MFARLYGEKGISKLLTKKQVDRHGGRVELMMESYSENSELLLPRFLEQLSVPNDLLGPSSGLHSTVLPSPPQTGCFALPGLLWVWAI